MRELIMAKAERSAYRTLIGSSEAVPAFVENCLELSIGETVGRSPLYERSARTIVLSGPKATAFPIQMSLLAEVNLQDPARAFLRLEYQTEGIPIDQRVQLTSTAQPLRWWFVCPVHQSRVAKLYLPPCARRFASRGAHGLIYQCQKPKPATRLSPNVSRLLRVRLAREIYPTYSSE